MDKQELAEELSNNFSYLKTERAKFESEWETCENYVAPSVFGFNNTERERPKRPTRFTSRPSNFFKILVTGLVGYSASPNIVWLKLSLEDEKALDSYGVKDWLESVERVIYAELNRTNFYVNLPKLVSSAGLYGHGVMLIDESPDLKMRFTVIPTADIYLDTDDNGNPDTIYRVINLTLRQAVIKFGKENLSSDLQLDYEDKARWNKNVEILHATYKRSSYNPEQKDGKNKEWASVYMETAKKHIIKESGYDTNPYAVFYWDQIPGTAYSESPASHALSDVKVLNKTNEARLKVAQLSAEPPMNVPESMRGQESVIPGGMNYMDKTGQVMSPVQTGANFPITLQVTEYTENCIKDWFHVDFFLTLQNQQRVLTATEVLELQGEKAATLAPLIVNLNSALSSCVERIVSILSTQNKLPMPPQALVENNNFLKIDFVGPLAQAQKKYHSTGGAAQALNFITPVQQLSPASMDWIDFDLFVKEMLESQGMPQRIIREQDDVDKIRAVRAEQQAQMQQQQMQMEQQKNLLGNLNKLNEPIKQGSVMQELTNQLKGGFE